MRSLLFTFALLCLVSASAACGGPATAPPKKPETPASAAIPPCPDAILPGGDPLEADAFEGKPVVRVCIVGGSEPSRKAAEKVIELRASEIYGADRVRGDLEALLANGSFDDASAYGLRVRDGAAVVLFYKVHDRPRIADIAFEGAKVLGNAALAAKLPVEKGNSYEPAKINVIAQAVREEYRSRGYDQARVVLVAEPASGAPGQVSVRIKVDEGPQWHFTKIDFTGNKRVKEAELRKVVELQVGQPFVREEVEVKALKISALYFDRGMVEMHVEAEAGTLGADGGLPMTFVIDEGNVYALGALHASKLGASVERELLDKVVRVRKKQIFSRSALLEDIERLKAFFLERKERVEITPITQVDPKTKTIDVTFEIDRAR